jgi:hypothetical protein
MSGLAAAGLRQPLPAALSHERQPDMREVPPLARGQLPPQLELLFQTVHLLAIQLVVGVRIQHVVSLVCVQIHAANRRRPTPHRLAIPSITRGDCGPEQRFSADSQSQRELARERRRECLARRGLKDVLSGPFFAVAARRSGVAPSSIGATLRTCPQRDRATRSQTRATSANFSTRPSGTGQRSRTARAFCSGWPRKARKLSMPLTRNSLSTSVATARGRRSSESRRWWMSNCCSPIERGPEHGRWRALAPSRQVRSRARCGPRTGSR